MGLMGNQGPVAAEHPQLVRVPAALSAAQGAGKEPYPVHLDATYYTDWLLYLWSLYPPEHCRRRLAKLHFLHPHTASAPASSPTDTDADAPEARYPSLPVPVPSDPLTPASQYQLPHATQSLHAGPAPDHIFAVHQPTLERCWRNNAWFAPPALVPDIVLPADYHASSNNATAATSASAGVGANAEDDGSRARAARAAGRKGGLPQRPSNDLYYSSFSNQKRHLQALSREIDPLVPVDDPVAMQAARLDHRPRPRSSHAPPHPNSSARDRPALYYQQQQQQQQQKQKTSQRQQRPRDAAHTHTQRPPPGAAPRPRGPRPPRAAYIPGQSPHVPSTSEASRLSPLSPPFIPRHAEPQASPSAAPAPRKVELRAYVPYGAQQHRYRSQPQTQTQHQRVPVAQHTLAMGAGAGMGMSMGSQVGRALSREAPPGDAGFSGYKGPQASLSRAMDLGRDKPAPGAAGPASLGMGLEGMGIVGVNLAQHR
jgi:hypothetical protein